MNFVHKELAAGRWARMTLCEQMANVGSEVHRVVSARRLGAEGEVRARQALLRALELLTLTVACAKGFHRLRELTRTRELLADTYMGDDTFHVTDEQWCKYFDQFAMAAALERRRRMAPDTAASPASV